jgi:dUTP pyrophosphatase
MKAEICVTLLREEVVGLNNLTLVSKLDDPVMPSYGTAGSVGLDFAAQEDFTIAPWSMNKTKLGFVVEFPDDLWGMLVQRSSLAKRGLILANCTGIVDTDYRGPEDEIMAVFRNLTDEPVTIKKGERIVQLILMPVIKPDQFTVNFVESGEGTSRGGFGSTGV